MFILPKLKTGGNTSALDCTISSPPPQRFCSAFRIGRFIGAVLLLSCWNDLLFHLLDLMQFRLSLISLFFCNSARHVSGWINSLDMISKNTGAAVIMLIVACLLSVLAGLDFLMLVRVCFFSVLLHCYFSFLFMNMLRQFFSQKWTSENFMADHEKEKWILGTFVAHIEQ